MTSLVGGRGSSLEATQRDWVGGVGLFVSQKCHLSDGFGQVEANKKQSRRPVPTPIQRSGGGEGTNGAITNLD